MYKDYFVFTSRERKGVWTLSVIVFILLGVRISLASIDANRADANAMCEDSLTSYVVDTLKSKYSSKSTYCESQDRPKFENKKRSVAAKKSYTNTEKLYIELNSADTTLLKKLPGIGSGFSNRIVRFRDKLGGFYSKEQLSEVYGLPEETYSKIYTMVWVDTISINRLDVNKLGISELKRHPYITYYQAKSIVEYRESLPDNKIKDINRLSELLDVAPNWYRIKYYLIASD